MKTSKFTIIKYIVFILLFSGNVNIYASSSSTETLIVPMVGEYHVKEQLFLDYNAQGIMSFAQMVD